jgi:hypothetical protein
MLSLVATFGLRRVMRVLLSAPGDDLLRRNDIHDEEWL